MGALTEILQPAGVHSEWRLLLPALARCGPGPVVLVGAPQRPFVPALAAQGLAVQRLVWAVAQSVAQRLWAAEQALRCAEVEAVLAWLPAPSRAEPLQGAALRRLQMAAAEHHKLLFVLRPVPAQPDASPAALRLQVAPAGDAAHGDALEVRVLKRRGPPLVHPLYVAARPVRLTLLLAASHVHALDRTAACA